MSALRVVDRSPEWHEIRRQGIGASDVPAICGMSTYATPVTIWEQKVGLREPAEDNALMEWGRRLEPVIADAFAERTGIAVRRRSREVRYRDWPVLFAHLDRTTPEGPLECKTAMGTRGWGEDGSAEVPPHIALQLQAQLLCADRPRGFVAALIGYRDFRVYEIPRDDVLLTESVLPLLHEFWSGVESQTPPEPDGSESYGAFLRRLHPRDDRPERPATPEEGLLVTRYLAAKRIAAEYVRQESELQQQIIGSIADTGGLIGPGWRITFRNAKETDWPAVAAALEPAPDLIDMNTKTDWREVAKTLRPRKELIEAHSTPTGSRRWHVSVEEEG